MLRRGQIPIPVTNESRTKSCSHETGDSPCCSRNHYITASPGSLDTQVYRNNVDRSRCCIAPTRWFVDSFLKFILFFHIYPRICRNSIINWLISRYYRALDIIQFLSDEYVIRQNSQTTEKKKNRKSRYFVILYIMYMCMT